MRNIEEPYKKGPSKKKDNPSDIKQSPMYKVGVQRKTDEDKQKSEQTSKEYIKGVRKETRRIDAGKASELEIIQESMPMSNKTIEYYRNRYQ